MKIEVDSHSGFCFGVDLAVEKAEEEIKKNGKVYCLGQIVHNDEEVKRLEDKGMVTIDHEQMGKLKGVTVLIRAHGEPPETYALAEKNDIKIIDASCPIVLKFQKRVVKAHEENDSNQVVIYGKKNHPEVIGLSGQIGYKAIVVENEDDLGKIDLDKPVKMFSQTTKPGSSYKKLAAELEQRISKHKGIDGFKINNTTCGQVSGRDKYLIELAKNNDVIVFVGGTKSSNAKTLYSLCKSINDRSYFISSVDELQKEWFRQDDTIGICGATSTPKWLMENTKDYILKEFDNKLQ